MKLAASIVGFTPEKNGDKEIQFVWAVSDGGSEPAERPAPSILPWKSAPSVPDMGSGVRIGNSRVFERISRDNPLRVSGNGVPMCPPHDPGDSFAIYVAAWEDDQEFRDWAERIDGAIKTQGGQALLGYALQGALGPIAPIMNVIIGAVKKKPDDFFVDGMHTGWRENYYGLLPESGAEQASFEARGPMDIWRVEREYKNTKGSIKVLYELFPEVGDAA